MNASVGTAPSAGLLYYMQDNTVTRVEAAKPFVRDLFMMRNELASHMVRRRRQLVSQISEQTPESFKEPDDVRNEWMPATIDDAFTCQRCYAVDTCMLYRKVST